MHREWTNTTTSFQYSTIADVSDDDDVPETTYFYKRFNFVVLLSKMKNTTL